MRASDIIRNLLDLIDRIDDAQHTTPAQAEVEIVVPAQTTPVDQNHFKQIFDIISADRTKMYNNSPNEVVTGIEAVTTNAGGGLNGPKDPADIRADSVAMYPGHSHGAR